MAVISRDLGPVTAYAAAVNRGYTGTREEFETLMASYATVAQEAGESASAAANSASDAESSASAAATSASDASSFASEANTSASNASNAATAAGIAQTAAESAKDAAQSAQTAAEAAQAGAEAAVDGFDDTVTAAISDVNAAGTNQKELAKRQAEKSEAWAVGQISGEDVGVSDPAYHNNAKYYAESAGTSATTATTKASEAAQSAANAAASASAAAESARTLTIDNTLTQPGQAADAKVVGDEIDELKNDLDEFASLSVGYGVDICGQSMVTGTRGNNGIYGNPLGATSVTTKDVIPVSPNTKYSLSFPGISIAAVSYYKYTSTSENDFDAKTSLAADADGTITFTTGATTYGVSFQSSNSSLAGHTCRIVLFDQKKPLLSYIDRNIDPIEEASARKFTTGKYLKTDGTEGKGNSYAVTGFVRFTATDRAVLEDVYGASNTLVYAFYNVNREFISGLGNFTGNADIDSTIIPSGTAFVRFCSGISHGENPKALVYNGQTLESLIEVNAENISRISQGKNVTITKNSTRLLRYLKNGYLNNDTGAFVPHNNYQCYYFDTTTDCEVWFDTQTTWGQIAVYNGTMFDPTNLVSIGSLGRSTLPDVNNKMHVAEGNRVVICINIGNDFSFHFADYTIRENQVKLIKKPQIRIVPISSTNFAVEVLDEVSGKYLVHNFIRTVYEDTLTYSGGTKSVVTSDIWYSDNIYDMTGNAIVQGNTNFIQSLAVEGHTGHVGAGHGAVVAEWSLFFADGEQFDPTTLTDEIECSSFRFMTRAKHYLRDTANSPSSGHSYPTLDENGDPIVVSVQLFDGEWTVNNRIKARNRLDIDYGTPFQFAQAHAAMCCGFYPYFDNVIINDNEYLWNEFTKTGSNPDTFSATNMGGTTTVLPCPATSKLDGGDTVILFGDEYRISTRIQNLNPTQYGSDNALIQTPPYADNRIKGYLMPCVCTDSNAGLKTGHGVETFHAGDRLDILFWREIDVT